jgi:hypothetical protein
MLALSMQDKDVSQSGQVVPTTLSRRNASRVSSLPRRGTAYPGISSREERFHLGSIGLRCLGGRPAGVLRSSCGFNEGTRSILFFFSK